MANQGIGVRYTTSGIRVLGLSQSGGKFVIEGIAAGSPEDTVESFLTSHGFSLNESGVVFGLCPGDFLSVSIPMEEGMEDEDVKEQLRWEIERKMISEPSEYFVDQALVDSSGFAFAGRRKLINDISGTIETLVTDVEPVSLLNGCEIAGEIRTGTVMLLSIEAEGISSAIVEKGKIRTMDSFPVREDELSSVLARLDWTDVISVDPNIVKRFNGYIQETIERLTSFGEDKNKPTPGRLILAGGGVYIGELATAVEKVFDLPTIVSDPFNILGGDFKEKYPEYTKMSAAFTTCLGLAVRALEN